MTPYVDNIGKIIDRDRIHTIVFLCNFRMGQISQRAKVLVHCKHFQLTVMFASKAAFTRVGSSLTRRTLQQAERLTMKKIILKLIFPWQVFLALCNVCELGPLYLGRLLERFARDKCSSLFVNGESFQNSVVFGVTGITRKQCTRLENISRDKHSSLFVPINQLRRKKFCEYGVRSFSKTHPNTGCFAECGQLWLKLHQIPVKFK